MIIDENPEWRPCVYSHKLWGSRVALRFRMVKILDYKGNPEELTGSDNVFAVVVAAHLRTSETKKDSRKRFRHKTELTKELYRRGLDKTDIINLYRFIDWIMRLPEELEKAYHHEIIKFEEERKMQYVTTAERIGMEKGEIIGMEKGEIIGLEKGETIGIKKGKLIGEILMAQRIIGHTSYSEAELESKTLAELEGIFAETEAKVTWKSE